MAAADQKNKAREVAGRLSYLRQEVFRTEGFGSNDPVPSLSAARKMHNNNKRAMAAQRPMPSVSQ